VQQRLDDLLGPEPGVEGNLDMNRELRFAAAESQDAEG
jgi:hypothetical protein